MPPLKNIRHEKFAQAIASTPISNAEAYQQVYNPHSVDGARASAARVLANASVKQRVSELLEQQELGLPQLVGCLKRHIFSENEGIALKAVEDGFKLHGCFDEERQDTNIGTINIVFGDAVQKKEGA